MFAVRRLAALTAPCWAGMLTCSPPGLRKVVMVQAKHLQVRCIASIPAPFDLRNVWFHEAPATYKARHPSSRTPGPAIPEASHTLCNACRIINVLISCCPSKRVNGQSCQFQVIFPPASSLGVHDQNPHSWVPRGHPAETASGVKKLPVAIKINPHPPKPWKMIVKLAHARTLLKRGTCVTQYMYCTVLS
jgi:hypothetical protein